MANGYPPFIFQDTIPAQQMMAHAQAVNEGLRISELGKARQAEGLFRIAQMKQQQKSQQEANDLNRMIAMSQIQQNKIAQDFKNRELEQRGRLESERNKNYAERSRLEFSPDRVFPQEAILERKIELEEEDRKRQEAAELGMITEAERALVDLDRKNEALSAMEVNDPKAQYINPPVIQARRNMINLQRKELLDGMKKKGYDYDPTSRKFIGVNRPSTTEYRPNRDNVGVQKDVIPDIPSASDLTVRPTPLGGSANLTPFEMRIRGLQSGDTVQQGGNTFSVNPSFQSNQIPPSTATLTSTTGDTGLDELRRRYPGVDFVRDGNQLRVGGFQWDERMRTIAENPNLSPEVKQTAIKSYLQQKYPDLFQQTSDAFQRYLGPIGSGAMSLIGR